MSRRWLVLGLSMVGVVSLLLLPAGGGAATPAATSAPAVGALAPNGADCHEAVQKLLNDSHSFGIGLKANGTVDAQAVNHPLTQAQHDFIKLAWSILDRDRISAEKACGHKCFLNDLDSGAVATLAMVGVASPNQVCTSA